MSMSHTSQRQSASATITVEYEEGTLVDRVEMTEDSSVVEVELADDQYLSISSSLPMSKSYTSHW